MSALATFLETARKRFDRALESERENRDRALEAIKFRNLEQWDPQVIQARNIDPENPRPSPVLDKTNQYLNQVINDYRQNRPSIKVRPVDDKGDEEVADVYNGIIRHIEDRSGADLAFDTAYEQAVDGGFGYFRILTEYCDEKTFEQDIRIARIRNRFQVVLDPDRQQPDGSDSKFAFVMERIHKDEFKERFPDAQPIDFANDGKVASGWIEGENIVVAEYFYIEETWKTLKLWPDGQVTLEDEKPSTDWKTPLRERRTVFKQVKWAKLNCKEILEGNKEKTAGKDWPGKYIPIVEVVGTELDIEGKSVKSGLLKGAMEPQRIHNYAGASFIEGIALAPRAIWIAAEEQTEGYEELYRTANRRPIALLPYKPVVMDGGVPVPPPSRVDAPGIPAGWLQIMQTSEHDIQSSMGMYAQTTLGIGDAQSGKQELLQQRRGDTATFHYSDNAARSIRYAGRILIDLIPRIYDTQRVARILGEDGKESRAQLDPTQPQAVMEKTVEGGAIQKIYNLSVGKYDVTASAGPSFLTKRMEATEFLTNAAQAAKDPMTAQVLTYLAVKNNDWAGAEEATQMLKKLLPPQVADNDEEGEEEVVQTPQGPIPVSQVGNVIAQMAQQLQQAGKMLEQADIAKTQNEAERLKIDLYEAETKRIEANADAARAAAETSATPEILRQVANEAAAAAVQQFMMSTSTPQ